MAASQKTPAHLPAAPATHSAEAKDKERFTAHNNRHIPPPQAGKAAAQTHVQHNFGQVPVFAATAARATKETSDNKEQDDAADKKERETTPAAASRCYVPPIQLKPLSPATTPVTTAPPVVQNVVSQPGEPLAPATRSFFEPRFGHSFGNVRVHTNAKAEASAQAVNARAYTVGQNIVFNSGQYAPSTTQGRHLLAHELSHVVQQGRGAQNLPSVMPGNSLEQDADNAATAVTQGIGPVAVAGASAPGLVRDAESMIKTLNPAALSDAELEREVRLLQGELVKRAKTSDPDTERLVQALDRLEAEAFRRHSVSKAPRNPLIPSVKGGNDKERLVNTIQLIQSVKQVGSGLYTIEIDGETKNLSQKDVDDANGKITAAIRDGIRQTGSKADYAEDGYNNQSAIDKEHWIVSNIVKTIGRIKDPGPFLHIEVGRARSLAKAAQKALADKNYAVAASLMADSEAAATSAKTMYQMYWQDIISVGETTITVLEYTRDASFIALGILATIASGGLAAGVLSAEAVGGSAATAGAIATWAPMVGKLGEAGMKVYYGDKVDWGQLAVDAVVTLILSKFGGKVGEGVAARIIGQNPAAQSLGKYVVANIVQSVIAGKASAAFTVAVNNVYARLKGDNNVTWASFTDQLTIQMLDPKSTFLDILNGAISGYGHGKAATTTKPAPTAAAAPTPRPAAASGGSTGAPAKAAPPPATTAAPAPVLPKAPAVQEPPVLPPAGKTGTAQLPPAIKPPADTVTPAKPPAEATIPQPPKPAATNEVPPAKAPADTTAPPPAAPKATAADIPPPQPKPADSTGSKETVPAKPPAADEVTPIKPKTAADEPGNKPAAAGKAPAEEVPPAPAKPATANEPGAGKTPADETGTAKPATGTGENKEGAAGKPATPGDTPAKPPTPEELHAQKLQETVKEFQTELKDAIGKVEAADANVAAAKENARQSKEALTEANKKLKAAQAAAKKAQGTPDEVTATAAAKDAQDAADMAKQTDDSAKQALTAATDTQKVARQAESDARQLEAQAQLEASVPKREAFAAKRDTLQKQRTELEVNLKAKQDDLSQLMKKLDTESRKMPNLKGDARAAQQEKLDKLNDRIGKAKDALRPLQDEHAVLNAKIKAAEVELQQEIERSSAIPEDVQEDLRKAARPKELNDYVAQKAKMDPATRQPIDPVYNKPVSVLSPDHIYPVAKIMKLPGFNRLSRTQQIEILTLRENIMGIDPSVNFGKRDRSWAEYEGLQEAGPIDPAIRKQLIQAENVAKLAVEKAIKERLKE
ncbi:eCIS core domain-containing protein [Deminuibacter soli]|uniref:eCIS core domain-containing protein n=1 Tax=Deminuibacter soli TaxID=2291815 RepID=UPI001B86EB70|nr:DUF4157 domain-containing protein [Deminuibacter soli]